MSFLHFQVCPSKMETGQTPRLVTELRRAPVGYEKPGPGQRHEYPVFDRPKAHVWERPMKMSRRQYDANPPQGRQLRSYAMWMRSGRDPSIIEYAMDG